MFQLHGRQNTARLTPAALQAHSGMAQQSVMNAMETARMQPRTDATATPIRNYAYSNGAANNQTTQSRTPYWQSERFESYRSLQRGSENNDNDSTGRVSFDPMAAFHRSHVDDDLESTITSASGYLAEHSNVEDSRSFFDPYCADNAPQTPASVHTTLSGAFTANCDNPNALPPYGVNELSVTASMHEGNTFWMNEQRSRMRNQPENVINSPRSHNAEVTNSNWSSAAVRSMRPGKNDAGLRRELASASASAQHGFGDSRKRPFLANDCAPDCNAQFASAKRVAHEAYAMQPTSKAASGGDNDAFLAPSGPAAHAHSYMFGSAKQDSLADDVSCADWAPAPSPAPPFASASGNYQSRVASWSRQSLSNASQRLQSSARTDDDFSAPASPTSPFKQPGMLSASQNVHPLSNAARADIEAKYKDYERNNSLMEKFGLNFSGRSQSEVASRSRPNVSVNTSGASCKISSENLFEAVNEFICEHGSVTQKPLKNDQRRRMDSKSDGGRNECKEQEGSSRLGVETSALLDQYQATRDFKKPEEYRSEAKRLKHYADSVTSVRPGPSDAKNLMVTLVKVGTYTEAVLVFTLCAAAMESKPAKYKPEQCAEFYADLLPLVQYVRQLAQTYQASRSPGKAQNDQLSDLLTYGINSISYLFDWYLHVKMFDARKCVLESSLQRIDETKSSLRSNLRVSGRCARPSGSDATELSDAVSSASMSSGYMSNSSSPLIHRRANGRGNMSSTPRADDSNDERGKQRVEPAFGDLCEHYEAALQDMALMCRAFDLREEALDLVRKIQALNVVSDGEHKRRWKRIASASKWPAFSVQHLELADFISFVRTFITTLMGTALAVLQQSGDAQTSRSKR